MHHHHRRGLDRSEPAPTLLHVDLFVSSMKRSLAFYVGVMGLRVVDDGPIEGELVRLLSAGRYSRARLVLLEAGASEAKVELLEFHGIAAGDPLLRPNRGTLTFFVEDLAAEVRRLHANGVETKSPIIDVELPMSGRSSIVLLSDPDGHHLELLQAHAR